jgi:hypothetical protein
MVSFRPVEYLRTLTGGRLVLWCYLLWYLSMAWMHWRDCS